MKRSVENRRSSPGGPSARRAAASSDRATVVPTATTRPSLRARPRDRRARRPRRSRPPRPPSVPGRVVRRDRLERPRSDRERQVGDLDAAVGERREDSGREVEARRRRRHRERLAREDRLVRLAVVGAIRGARLPADVRRQGSAPDPVEELGRERAVEPRRRAIPSSRTSSTRAGHALRERDREAGLRAAARLRETQPGVARRVGRPADSRARGGRSRRGGPRGRVRRAGPGARGRRCARAGRRGAGSPGSSANRRCATDPSARPSTSSREVPRGRASWAMRSAGRS